MEMDVAVNVLIFVVKESTENRRLKLNISMFGKDSSDSARYLYSEYLFLLVNADAIRVVRSIARMKEFCREIVGVLY